MIKIKFIEISPESITQQTISLYKILKSTESSQRQKLAIRLRRARKRIYNKIKKSAEVSHKENKETLDAYFLLKTSSISKKP